MECLCVNKGLKAEWDDAVLDKAEHDEVNIPSVRADSPIIACQLARCCTLFPRSIVYYTVNKYKAPHRAGRPR